MKKYNSIIAVCLLTLSVTGCKDKPKNVGLDIAIPVTVTELTKGSISQLINTTGTAQPTYGVTLNSEMKGIYKLQRNPRTRSPSL